MRAIPSHERLERAAPDAWPPAQHTLAPTDRDGALIANRYQLTGQIHAGRAGILYRAEDQVCARPVALRLLTRRLSDDAAVGARLQARLAARKDLSACGDIVDVLDLGRSEDGLVFVVTELLVGESLAALLAREGPLAWPTLRPWMVRACQILQLSHERGLPRLDLRTRHLFPVRDKAAVSTLKILSPGIEETLGVRLRGADLRYAAPEQVTGGPLDVRTDIYALGVIMLELLGGQRPVAEDARTGDEALFPAAVRARLPEAVVGIVARALARRPEDRWPTMRALANAMAAIDFGPCDASGVLEMIDVEVPAPAASSTSMRIDPAAGHAPSPALRPRTLPPPRQVDVVTSVTSPGSSVGRSVRPRRSFAWAAAAVLVLGATTGGLQMLRPRHDAAVIAVDPAVHAVHAVHAVTRDRGVLPANIARNRASVLGSAARREVGPGLSKETSGGRVNTQVLAPRDPQVRPARDKPGAGGDRAKRRTAASQGPARRRGSRARASEGGDDR